MAPSYDSVYDGISLYGISSSIPGWIDVGVYLMDIQLIIALAVGLCACLYMLRMVAANFKKSDVDAKCGGCSVKEDSHQSDR